jgi:hypothetical protein
LHRNAVHFANHICPLSLRLIIQPNQVQGTVYGQVRKLPIQRNAAGRGLTGREWHANRDITRIALIARKGQNVRGFVHVSELSVHLPNLIIVCEKQRRCPRNAVRSQDGINCPSK